MLLVWTTTPWTLVSNAAVAVDPELTYVRSSEGYVLAEALAARVLGDGAVVTDRFTLPAGRQAKLMWTSGAFPWPGQRIGGIEIDYAAGFGDGPEDVAESLKLAVKRLVAHAYTSRDPGTLAGPLPSDVVTLVGPWRRVSL